MKCLFCGRPVQRDPRARYCAPECKRAIEGMGAGLRRASQVFQEDDRTRPALLHAFESIARVFREGTEPKQVELPGVVVHAPCNLPGCVECRRRLRAP